MVEKEESVERCEGCGLVVAGGTAGCQRLMDEFLARDFSDVTFFRVHRLMVDTYALQHPERYCASVKSMAAHLTGLCWLLEHGQSGAVGSEPLRRWLEGRPRLAKPEVPDSRGRLTILEVLGTADPVSYATGLERWARSTWDAYASLHALARRWIEEAFDAPRPTRR